MLLTITPTVMHIFNWKVWILRICTNPLVWNARYVQTSALPDLCPKAHEDDAWDVAHNIVWETTAQPKIHHKPHLIIVIISFLISSSAFCNSSNCDDDPRRTVSLIRVGRGKLARTAAWRRANLSASNSANSAYRNYCYILIKAF